MTSFPIHFLWLWHFAVHYSFNANLSLEFATAQHLSPPSSVFFILYLHPLPTSCFNASMNLLFGLPVLLVDVLRPPPSYAPLIPHLLATAPQSCLSLPPQWHTSTVPSTYTMIIKLPTFHPLSEVCLVNKWQDSPFLFFSTWPEYFSHINTTFPSVWLLYHFPHCVLHWCLPPHPAIIVNIKPKPHADTGTGNVMSKKISSNSKTKPKKCNATFKRNTTKYCHGVLSQITR